LSEAAASDAAAHESFGVAERISGTFPAYQDYANQAAARAASLAAPQTVPLP